MLINLTIIKIQTAIIKKSITLWIKAPYSIFVLRKVMDKLEKSIPPKTNPNMGVKILFTKLVTIYENAPPIITPTAKSITFPLAINFLNSLTFFLIIHLLLHHYFIIF